MFKLLVFDFLNTSKALLVPRMTFASDCNKKSEAKHHYPKEVETSINEQIVTEFAAGYTYLSMAAYFGRTDIALPGCHAFFLKMYQEEQDHAFKLIDYQNMRGGQVHLCSVALQSDDQDWKSVCNAFSMSLKMENNVKEVSMKQLFQ